jgi:hypothetical protein
MDTMNLNANHTFQQLYDRAHAAGQQAVQQAVSAKQIQPMTVGSATSFFTNEIDYSRPTYFVEDGPCGFAWVNVRPGNSRFANWLKQNRHARRDEYYGGVSISIRDYDQSEQKKRIHATAFAEVLKQAGFNACAFSRLD